MKTALGLFMLLVLFLLPATGKTQKTPAFRLGKPFGEHMVFQAGVPLPVWGTAPPGETVHVLLAGETREVRAEAKGKWEVTFPPRKASASPISLRATCGDQAILLGDILVGEVWLASGQSNMEFPLRRARTAREAVKGLPLPLLRIFRAAPSVGGGARPFPPKAAPLLDPKVYFQGHWTLSTPEKALEFSAVAYFFARKLQETLKVPVGIMEIARGGTPAEAWIPKEALASDPVLRALVRGNWLENPALEAWCRERARTNLKKILDRVPRGELGPHHPFEPAFCWKAGIEPLLPFPIRGVLWYQGESNAETFERVVQHRGLFPLLIRSWRKAWSREDLPFLFVQLPGMGRPWWPWFRQSQLETFLHVPGTGMAVTMDLGDPKNVHPRAKKPVGERLALLALERVYRKKIPGTSPIFRRVVFQKNRAIVEFDHAGKGLATADGKPPRWFELAGEDKVFRPARARIQGTRVILSAPDVLKPAFARYAWVPFPDPPVNLTGPTGLPASPFTTDPDWAIPPKKK